ncbi:RecX family transcriptional regulator [Alphaproteobacteria bacterium]|nr:RecX family transcriptional regulator [Alphaproteobacteria bacterium]MDB3974091.1 RecX family transcriptional regulator [Alphaproteobacteria bacterium]
MKKDLNEYLFNEAIKYLGKYPATCKKIKEHLQKKIKDKKTYARAIFPEGVDKEEIIDGIVNRLDELKIINENHFIESLFHYYQQSLFSIRKIKNKLFQKGFDPKAIDEFVDQKFYENPELEIEILKKYIIKKKLNELEEPDLKKKLYRQSFSENSIFRVLKD